LRHLRIQSVWTPTEASRLNLIEAQFGVLKRFTLANTDDPNHALLSASGNRIVSVFTQALSHDRVYGAAHRKASPVRTARRLV
jgi:hypothetical protein